MNRLLRPFRSESAASALLEKLPDRHMGRKAPGPSGLLSGWPLLREPLSFLEKMFREHGNVASMRVVNLHLYLIGHPEGVKHVLQDNQRNYRKAQRYKVLSRIFGQGIISSEGSLWRKQRRLMQPIFHRQKLDRFASLTAECTTEMLDQWRSRAEQQETFDVAADMMRLTLQIIGRALLSMDLTERADSIGHNTAIANQHLGNGLSAFLPWLPTISNTRFHYAAYNLRTGILDLVAERRRESRDYGDLLSMLLAVRDEETGDGMSDEQLRDEVLTLIITGHETTAAALSWTWYLLSQNLQAEQRLHAELDQVLGGRPPSIQDLPNLNYTSMVIHEAMRLYPPAWGMRREAIEDDEIMGYHVPKSYNVMLSQWLVHRHPDFWPNPNTFEPERFSADRVLEQPRYAYFPFGGGPRTCLASLFALSEAQIVLACIAQKYRLRVLQDHPIVLQPLVTLRPRYGVKVALQRRLKSDRA
jgi:cytochrome P450